VDNVNVNLMSLVGDVTGALQRHLDLDLLAATVCTTQLYVTSHSARPAGRYIYNLRRSVSRTPRAMLLPGQRMHAVRLHCRVSRLHHRGRSVTNAAQSCKLGLASTSDTLVQQQTKNANFYGPPPDPPPNFFATKTIPGVFWKGIRYT